MDPADSNNHARDDALASLIARAGARATASDADRARVRSAAHDAWHHALQLRRARRVLWAGVAAALVVAIGATLDWRLTRAPAAPAALASLAYAQGEVQLHSTYTPGDPAHDRGLRAQLYAGDEISTGQDSGARIVFANGIGLRIAADTEMRWRSATQLELRRGSLYIDSGPQHAALAVLTRYGEVSHLGTRYLVQAGDERLRVTVRDGTVTLASQGTQTQLGAGERLDVDGENHILRGVAAPSGEEWSWADALGPPFDIDGRTLDEFLAWAATAGGRQLEYADAAAHEAALRTVLHGQVAARSPDEALSAVLPTTDFSARILGERVIIARK